MAKISIIERHTHLRLIVEGDLVGPWAAQLKSACEKGRDFQGSHENDKPTVKSDVNNYREGNDTSAYFQHEGADTNERKKSPLR